MPLLVRVEGEVAILGGVARLMNDARYVDAAGEVDTLLDEGVGRFVVAMQGVRELGPSLLGVLMTLSRRVRGRGAEIVLADVAPPLARALDEMRLDDYWDLYPTVAGAVDPTRVAPGPAPARARRPRRNPWRVI